MEKLKSIRFSMFLYVGLALLIGQLCYMGVVAMIDNALMDLMNPRPQAIAFVAGRQISITFGSGEGAASEIINPPLFEFLRMLRTISPFIIFSVCVIIGIFLFYRRSIQKPLDALNEGIRKISAQELDFSLECDAKNELGRLCGAFDTMRRELSQAFQSLWKSEENQRNLYRAFAHDLRTPLTIIKGNNDNIELVAAKNNDWALALQAVNLSNGAIARIETYTEQLRQLEGIEDWQPDPKKTDLSALAETIVQQATVICNQHGKEIVVSKDVHGYADLDADMLQRILDNLLINAVQYARQTIRLVLEQKDGRLCLTVSDDGPGFDPEAIKQGIAPFYSTKKAEGHTGIGLTISQKLLTKLQSTLSIDNVETGGACVGFSVPV